MSALGFLVALSSAAAAPPAPVPLAPPPESETVQGTHDGYERMTVPVDLLGKGPYQFLIDTGSQRTVVSSMLAEDLNLAIGPSVRLVGVAGEKRVRTAALGDVMLGSRMIYDLEVPLLAHTDIGADGIVGTDSLQDQRVLLDFTNHQIHIGDAEQLGGNSGYEIIVRARRKSGQLIVTEAYLDGVRTQVVIDTGSTISVGNLALQRALRSQREKAGSATLHSVTGQKVDTELGVAPDLKVGAFKIQNLVIAFSDTPAFRELRLLRQPALFLGMRELRAFRRVAIDFSSRKVMFDVPRS